MIRARFVEVLSRWREGDGPLYQRLAESIRAAIERGDLGPGTRLPAERVLARMLRVSRTTVVMAYDGLVQEDWLQSRRGSGTQVSSSRARSVAARERGAVALGARNVVLRGLIEQTGADIEFHGAHFDGLPDVFDQVWSEARADLARLLQSHGYMPLGLDSLREAIAIHLERAGLPTRPDQVLVTAGAQQAIALAAHLFVAQGDLVVLEDPTYPGAIDAFGSIGARLKGVPTGPEGVDVGRLRDIVTEGAPRVVYLIPTCHNPTGSVLPEPARREVARNAGRSDAVWIEDLTLADLAFDGSPPAPLAAHATAGTVLTVGSLSKLFWGGLRVGWIRGPAPVISRLARLKVVADLSGSLVSQAVAVRVLARAADLAAIRQRQARERLDRVGRLLARRLPSWRFQPPTGGLSLWIRIPMGEVAEFAALARGRGVAIVPGTANSPEGRFPDHLRLPFVGDPAVVDEGIRRLGDAWDEYAAGRSDGRRVVDVLV